MVFVTWFRPPPSQPPPSLRALPSAPPLPPSRPPLPPPAPSWGFGWVSFLRVMVISRFLLPGLDLLLLGSLFHVHVVGDLDDTRVVDVALVTLVLKTFGTLCTSLC